ncbi:MAG: transporter permease [Lachnospiraceae bacterium]|nr:transporter permease [Lachnospiraceae bacterium]
MKKYRSFFRLRFEMGLQYRAAALAGVVTQFTWGFMEILVYGAFYKADASLFPMTLTALGSYIWLQQAFLAFFMAWFMEEEIFEAIIDGNIAYELCRPISIYSMWFTRSVANRLSRAVLRCFPILLVAAFLPKPFGLTAPGNLATFVLFVLTMLLGLLVTVAFCMLVYVLTFFTVSPQGLRILFVSSVEFFSGAVIPLPFFPDKIRSIMELLPFASMQNVPLRVYSEDLAGTAIGKAIILQVIWLFVLVGLGKLLCSIAVRRVTLQGG